MIHIDYDTVENYYKRLVFDHIIHEYGDTQIARSPGAIEDIACLALNQLPPRYVRHSIDTAFYITVEERREMNEAVRSAVQRAAEYVAGNPREPLSGVLPKHLPE